MVRISRTIALVILVACWQSIACVARANVKATIADSLTKEQWREDLEYLAKELPRRHKNAFHTISRAQFERAIAELNAAIPSLQEHEILVGLRRIIAMVGDAHTALAPQENFHRY